MAGSAWATIWRRMRSWTASRPGYAPTSLDVCVVHLRRPVGGDGKAKQLEQNRALLRWTMRHLAKNPKSNLAVMGDFNEGEPPGSPDQALAVLFKARPPLVDIFDFARGKAVTHADGKAYDRILVSEAVAKGLAGLRLEGVTIQEHRHGKGPDRRLYTDHYPVGVRLSLFLGINASKVRRWRAHYDAGGWEALQARSLSGRLSAPTISVPARAGPCPTAPRPESAAACLNHPSPAAAAIRGPLRGGLSAPEWLPEEVATAWQWLLPWSGP